MGLCLFQKMEQRLTLKIALTGGTTQTIFPRVERWLQEDGDRWKALQYIGGDASMEKYRSAVDYIYAQTIPGARAQCFRYYASSKPEHMAGSIIRWQDRRVIEAKLLLAMEIAYQCWCAKRRTSWKKVRETMQELAA